MKIFFLPLSASDMPRGAHRAAGIDVARRAFQFGAAVVQRIVTTEPDDEFS
jgi:hypothetical protein